MNHAVSVDENFGRLKRELYLGNFEAFSEAVFDTVYRGFKHVLLVQNQQKLPFEYYDATVNLIFGTVYSILI